MFYIIKWDKKRIVRYVQHHTSRKMKHTKLQIKISKINLTILLTNTWASNNKFYFCSPQINTKCLFENQQNQYWYNQ